MSEHAAPTDPAPLRRSSRRAATARVDPKDAARRRWLTVAAVAGVLAVVAVYLVIDAGRRPDGPVAELQRFAAAFDARDADGLIALWDPAADLDAARKDVTELLGKFGGPGATPHVEPPRVRVVDDHTWRGIHRMGDVDLETLWVWDGARFRMARLGIAQ